MIRQKTTSRLALFGLLAATFSLQSGAIAQTVAPEAIPQPDPSTIRGTYGPWSVLCDTPTGARFEQCAMVQNVVAGDRPDLGLSIVVLKTADGKSRILRVLAPLGVLLPNGLGLFIDNVDKGRAYFIRCFGDGCYAEVVLEDQLLTDLRGGTNAVFTVFQTPEEGIGIPVDLTSFTEAFAALP